MDGKIVDRTTCEKHCHLIGSRTVDWRHGSAIRLDYSCHNGLRPNRAGQILWIDEQGGNIIAKVSRFLVPDSGHVVRPIGHACVFHDQVAVRSSMKSGCQIR